MQDYWVRQTADKPLDPDLLWSQPENRAQAGKLLIVGGNAHGFAAAGEAYSQAIKSGIGTARVLLPDSLQKTVGRVFEAGEYAPSTPSGSFSKKALGELLPMSQWADGVLLAGDFGRNSETAIMLEQLLDTYAGQLTITKDAADYYILSPDKMLSRVDTTLVISFAQLQKLASNAHFPRAFTFEMDFLRLIELLHEFTEQYSIHLLTKHLDNIFVAVSGQVSSTKLNADLHVWRVRAASNASVWWLQNPTNTFAALTSSMLGIAEKRFG